MNDPIQNHLQTYCTNAFPAKQNLRITNLNSISAGWESDVYSFTLEHQLAGESARDNLILRIYPGDSARDKSAREFDGMRRLHRAGYPVPEVLVLELENSPFGQPFVIMEKIEGEMLWPLLFGGGERAQELMTLFCKLFVDLHTLEWRPFVDDVSRHDTGDPFIFIDQMLDVARSALEQYPWLGLAPVIEWLEARRDQVPCLRPSFVHLDYHPGNILLRADGTAIVIDWTQVDISDPRFDLAWTLLLVGMYEGAEWRDVILKEYERLAGAQVEQTEYFDVFACAKRLFDVLVSLSEGPEKLGMRPEAAAQMRKQMGATRKVYDLLLERTGITIPEVEKLLASVMP